MFGKRAGNLLYTLRQQPQAWAELTGDQDHPDLTGLVRFYQTQWGVLVAAEVFGLPAPAGACTSPVFGLHIHQGGDPADPGPHYNPEGCSHPHHAGDLPPLFGNCGYAFQAVLTDRFSLQEVEGRTLVLHGGPDDFTSQPGGNAGTRIAAGRIRMRGLH